MRLSQIVLDMEDVDEVKDKPLVVKDVFDVDAEVDEVAVSPGANAREEQEAGELFEDSL